MSKSSDDLKPKTEYKSLSVDGLETKTEHDSPASDAVTAKIEYKSLRSLSMEELSDEIKKLNEPSFRASQIYDWVHSKMAASYDEMTNVPKKLRNSLMEKYSMALPKVIREQISAKDGTRKYLMELCDKELIECVLMRYSYGSSICVSSQAGCRMGCRFCASTIGGLNRSLEAGEILGEVYAVSRIIGEKISHVVMMGMGEPLDNYDNTVRFIRMITDEKGQNISARNITLSTCGIVPNMRKLASENLPVTLALSLHGATQSKRERLMPIARKYVLSDVLDACRFYFDKTGRRISFEYALVKGQNDNDDDIDELVDILADSGFHLNVIPVNPVEQRDFMRPDREHVNRFVNALKNRGVNVTVRREMGSDIDGACGQLRGRHMGAEQND